MQANSTTDSTTIITAEEADLILQIRLLIARAAAQDSLQWWEDQALMPAGVYVLDRIFPMAPLLAARSLALKAAQVRHRAAADARDEGLHLYHLDRDKRDRLVLEARPLLEIPFPEAPISSIGALREQLQALTGQPMPYQKLQQMGNGRLQIRVPSAPASISPWLHRAQTLAWAYLEGQPKQPVFPFTTDE